MKSVWPLLISGQLSAKMRSKYPELVTAAVGSSAPLHLQLDTYGSQILNYIENWNCKRQKTAWTKL